MNKELYTYLERRWRFSNHTKYQKYFKLWLENLTDNQIYYFKKDMIKENK